MHFQQTHPNDGIVDRFCKKKTSIAETLPSHDQGMVYKIGPHIRNWGAFAEKSHDTARYEGGGANRVLF